MGGSLYALARRTVTEQIDADRPRMPAPAAVISAHLDHLVLTALHAAEMLRYQSIPALARRRDQAEHVRLFGRAVEAARGRVRAALR